MALGMFGSAQITYEENARRLRQMEDAYKRAAGFHNLYPQQLSNTVPDIQGKAVESDNKLLLLLGE